MRMEWCGKQTRKLFNFFRSLSLSLFHCLMFKMCTKIHKRERKRESSRILFESFYARKNAEFYCDLMQGKNKQIRMKILQLKEMFVCALEDKMKSIIRMNIIHFGYAKKFFSSFRHEFLLFSQFSMAFPIADSQSDLKNGFSE